ncbi:MAG: oligosaccharide flippase family protein, partial [Candidatus Omnitrophota bacterium]
MSSGFTKDKADAGSREKINAAKNTLILSFAEAYNILCGMIIVVALAHIVGNAGLGLYSFSFSAGAVACILALFGSNDYIVREVSRYPAKRGYYFTASLISRGTILIACVILLEILFRFLNYPVDKKTVFYLIFFTRVLDSFLFTFYSFFRAFQKMIYEGAVRLALNTVSLAFGLIFLFRYRDLGVFAAVQLVTYFLFSAATFYICGRFFIHPGVFSGNFHAIMKNCRDFIRESLHLSVIQILLVLYVQINTILLTLIKGEA